MSTDTRPLQNPPPREAGHQEPARPKIDLSVAQVLGGALAAMTAAFLGSRLSVAGTVVGAALASVVAAVAGSVYTASLRSTQHRVRTVFQGRLAGSGLPTRVESVQDREAAAPVDAPAQPSAPAATAGSGPRDARPRLSWRYVAVAALAAFALAGVALTGVELATGSALSGGDGTTITQVTEPRGSDPRPAGSPSPEPSDAAPTATPSATPEPSAPAPVEPSSTPEPTPDPGAGASSAPAPAPAPVPSASSSAPSAEPTPAASGTPTDQG